MIVFGETSDVSGLFTGSNYLNYRHPSKEFNIRFSVTKKGDAAYCHFCSDKRGLRFVSESFNQFAEFVFEVFDWCEMIIVTSTKNSINKALMKCGFKLVKAVNGGSCFARKKEWAV